MVTMDVFFKTALTKGMATVDKDAGLVRPYVVLAMTHTADVKLS